MVNPNLLSVLAGMMDGGGEDAPPDALPALDLSSVADAPQPDAGSMPLPGPHPSQVPTEHGASILSQLMPMIMSAVVGAKNPLHGAALAHGYAQGATLAYKERQDAQERDDKIRELGTRFMQQTAADVLRLKDPVERQRYLQFAHDIGVHQFKLPDNWTQQIPAQDSGDDAQAWRDELTKNLKAFDNDARFTGIAGTPQEAKIGIPSSNGSIPANVARALTRQQVTNVMTGQPEYGDQPVEADGKTEQERAANLLKGIRDAKARGDQKRAAELQATYDDLIRVKRDAAAPPASLDSAILAAYRTGDKTELSRLLALKRQSGDAGRALPGSGMGMFASGPEATFASPAEAMKSLTPGEQAIVNRMLEYKHPLPTGIALTKGYWPKLLEVASAVDPSFDVTQYQARQRGRNAFTSGKEAQNIRGLNTAVGHINSLTQAAAALQNSDWQDKNAAMNAMAAHLPVTKALKLRQGAVTDARTKFNAVTGELASIFKQSGATDQEIQSWKGTIGGDPASATPNQWKAFIHGSLELMGSRMQALSSQYETVMGKPKDFKFLSPASRAILSKLGADMDALDPGGTGQSQGTAVEEWVRDASGRLVKKGG